MAAGSSHQNSASMRQRTELHLNVGSRKAATPTITMGGPLPLAMTERETELPALNEGHRSIHTSQARGYLAWGSFTSCSACPVGVAEIKVESLTL
jgi:hypothetical protein